MFEFLIYMMLNKFFKVNFVVCFFVFFFVNLYFLKSLFFIFIFMYIKLLLVGWFWYFSFGFKLFSFIIGCFDLNLVDFVMIII